MIDFSILSSVAGTPHFAAAAASNTLRALAAAMRMGSQPSRVDVEPPVSCTPSTRAVVIIAACIAAGALSASAVTLPYTALISACSTRTLLQSASSSSATSMASTVYTPCPISWRGTCTTTVLSGNILSHALNAISPAFTCGLKACALATRRHASVVPMASAPPTRPLPMRKTRRAAEYFFAAMITRPPS